MEIIERGNVSFLCGSAITKESGLIHGFTLRHGGVSEGDFKSLNMGLRRGDDVEKAKENISIAARALCLCEKNLTLTYQTHTANVRKVTEKEIGRGLCEQWSEGVDAIVTNMLNVPLMCYSADCVPTLLFDREKKVIAAVHGGWRGTAENIVKNTVDLMKNEYGCDGKNILAVIGPAIGICCYEVSEDVAVCFDRYDNCKKSIGNGKYMLDLKAVTALQLQNAGLSEENVENSGVCTACSNDSFFSHRKQSGRSGLLGGFIQLI